MLPPVRKSSPAVLLHQNPQICLELFYAVFTYILICAFFSPEGEHIFCRFTYLDKLFFLILYIFNTKHLIFKIWSTGRNILLFNIYKLQTINTVVLHCTVYGKYGHDNW